MSGVNKCLKYSMFVFNFLFWVCGCIILGVSIYLRVDKGAQQKLNLQEGGLLSAVDVMIAVGAIIMVLGFFGCCGAIRESRCLLMLFFIGLLLILALQITAGVLGLVYKPKIEEAVDQSLQSLLPLNEQPLDVQESFEKVQNASKCCGIVKGSTDWGNSPPPSCRCTPGPGSKCSGLYYEETCKTVFIDYFKNHLIIIIGIAFGLAVIELIGLGFSMSLYCQIGKK
ncbi:tetraspanin-8 [Gastrophryne carolinensis]